MLPCERLEARRTLVPLPCGWRDWGQACMDGIKVKSNQRPDNHEGEFKYWMLQLGSIWGSKWGVHYKVPIVRL